MNKEEIISRYLPQGYSYENIMNTEGFAKDMATMAHKAMEEYSDQETASLRAENERLRGLIQSAHITGWLDYPEEFDKPITSDESWEKFKNKNNL